MLEPVDEADFLGTNGSAQYGLSAIQNLALIGDHLPQRIPYLPEPPAAGAPHDDVPPPSPSIPDQEPS